MVANLNGDFIKGNQYDKLPSILKEGVILHRKIDDFIDTDEEVLLLKRHLSLKLPKVSAIAIDLYFDHLLARNWEKYHTKKLTPFLEDFYMHEITFHDHLHPKFKYLLERLKSDRWMNNYVNKSGLNHAAIGLSKRISFPNELHKALVVFEENEALITKVFEEFMPKAIAKFN